MMGKVTMIFQKTDTGMLSMMHSLSCTGEEKKLTSSVFDNTTLFLQLAECDLKMKPTLMCFIRRGD